MNRIKYNYNIIETKGARKLKTSRASVDKAYKYLEPHLSVKTKDSYPQENKDDTPVEHRRKWFNFSKAIYMELRDKF